VAAVLTPLSAQTFTVLHVFTGNPDGADPQGNMILHNGNLYGSTIAGGMGTSTGCGTVFKFNLQTRQETVLYRFSGCIPGSADGSGPFSGLISDSAGNFYGSTISGPPPASPSAPCYPSGCGTVFQYSSGGETVLGALNGTTGQHPEAGLIRDAAGNFYGTSQSGGATGGGTVFKLDTSNNLTALYSFHPGASHDGNGPKDSLLLLRGNLFGTTLSGGTNGQGTVFAVNAATGVETVLLRFSGLNGANPIAGLIADTSGNLYGTTTAGGSGCGVVYKLNVATRVQTVLHTFDGTDGCTPTVNLIRDAQGNLYGETEGPGGGTVFKLDPAGVLTVLHNFVTETDGSSPYGLNVDSQGNFYGSTNFGGPAGFGTLFEITP